VDTLGLLMAVIVTAASLDDGRAALGVLGQLGQDRFPRLKKLWADQKYRNHTFNQCLSDKPFAIEVVDRPSGARGFVLLPQRWVVERTFAWLGRYRRHSP
jgi:putative transposase